MLTDPPWNLPPMPISTLVLERLRNALVHVDNNSVAKSRSLQALDEFQRAGDNRPAIQQIWATASPDFARLILDSVLSRSLLDALADEVLRMIPLPRDDLAQVGELASEALKFVVVAAPDHPVSFFPPGLPLEVYEEVNRAFELRMLALHPEKVLPKGKTLLSLFMKKPDEGAEEVRKRSQAVAQTIKRAYWEVVSNTCVMSFA